MNKQGHLNNYGNVWYHPKDISNILSMRNVKKKNRIKYDFDNGGIFIVIITRTGGHDMVFKSNNDRPYNNGTINTEGVSIIINV